MIVSIKESNIIKPEKETPKTNLWVSDLDLVVQKYYVPTVYFYQQFQDQTNVVNTKTNFFEARVLKNALIVPFYPIAGTLGTDANGRLNINCNANGVLFVEAETISSLDDFGDFTPCPEMEHLLPTIDSSLDISSKPLFAAQLYSCTCFSNYVVTVIIVSLILPAPLKKIICITLQLTRFKCGSVCLGVLFHHTLVDGISAIHFINSWSEVAFGISISIPPFIDRTITDARDPPTRTFHHTEYDPPPTMSNPSILAPTCARILKITPDQLTTLKSKFNNKDPGVAFTTFEILAARIWYCMCKARGLPDDQPTKLHIPIDGRFRLIPPLPQGYFGNVQFTTTALSSAGEVRSTPLEQTMNKIRQALRKMDDEYLRSALDYIKKQPDPTVLRRGVHTYKYPNLAVVSWTKLPLYEADFGWGRPVHMGRAKIGKEGAAYILPNPNPKDTTLSLTVFLPNDHIDFFEKYFYEV